MDGVKKKQDERHEIFKVSDKTQQFFSTLFAQNPGISAYQMAREIGITYSYLMALQNGRRPADRCSVEVVRQFAVFAGISPIHVSMAFGIYQSSDFIIEAEKKSYIKTALDRLKAHKVWGTYLPRLDLESLDEETKILISMMFLDLEKYSSQHEQKIIGAESAETVPLDRYEKA